MEKCDQGNIFLVLHCLVILVQSLDFILVMRWNRLMGFPDVFFFLGDEILVKFELLGLFFFGFDLVVFWCYITVQFLFCSSVTSNV